jgi:dienelactone hydrolase
MTQNTASLTAHAERLLAHSRLILPKGEAPHPLVLLLHGCGGAQPYLADYAAAAVEAGVAALIVDSFAPRGISRLNAHATVCTGLRLRGVERAMDVFALLAWAQTLSASPSPAGAMAAGRPWRPTPARRRRWPNCSTRCAP